MRTGRLRSYRQQLQAVLPHEHGFFVRGSDEGTVGEMARGVTTVVRATLIVWAASMVSMRDYKGESGEYGNQCYRTG